MSKPTPTRPAAAIATLAIASLSFAACARDSGDGTMGAFVADVPGSDAQAIHAVCPAGDTTFGIDVSKWQGNIDWSAVAGAGVKFALIRVSDGTGYHDEKYAQNWAGARANGVVRGTYQFFRSDEDPIAQADLLISTMGPLEPGDLPPVADVESTDGVSNATRAARLHAWLDHVEAAVGVKPIIYTGGYFWQDNVGQDFSAYPLWHAGYTGGDCPSTVANQWGDWAFWQFTSSGHVAGIGGNVDENRFNGTLADLQTFAHANRPPVGWLDGVDCDGGARGWSQDPDVPDQSIAVHVYIDGPAGSGAHGFPTTANVHRDDLCAAIGSCEHGFALPIPLAYRDGAAHTAIAYGIDSAGGNNPQLAQSGLSFSCDPPALPKDVRAGVLRHVTSPDVMGAWGFAFDDVARYGDDVINAYVQAADWGSAPGALVRADGAATVYVTDSDGARRAVSSPASMDAWHFAFSDVQVLPADQVDGMPLGAPLPDAPFLLRGAGPAVYVLDNLLPPSAGEGEGEGEGGGVGEGEGEGEGPGAGPERVTLVPPPSAGGCGATGAGAAPVGGLLLLVGAARRGRRRHGGPVAPTAR